MIDWIGVVGAWLLVAGPLYQGALELLEHDIDREGFARVIDGLEPPVMPSAWWWLLPPVMVVLRRRRNEAHRRAVRARLTAQQRAQFGGFARKASGWFVVAAGASLLAAKETWELAEHQEWPVWLFVVVVSALVALTVLNAAHVYQAGVRPQ